MTGGQQWLMDKAEEQVRAARAALAAAEADKPAATDSNALCAQCGTWCCGDCEN